MITNNRLPAGPEDAILSFMIEIPKVMVIMESSRISGQLMMAGLAQYARLHGPWIFITETPYYIRAKRRETLYKWILRTRPHGIIMRDTDLVPGLENLHIPIIVSRVLYERPHGFAAVTSNDEAIGQMAASYFLERGYRHFAYCGFKDMPWSRRRCRGFQNFLTAENRPIHLFEKRRSRSGGVMDAEQQSLIKWLQGLPKPVAVMTCNDDRGRQLLDACRIAGIHAPEEVAVLGVDNETTVCSLSYPSLSSIVLNFRKSGYDAAALLGELMAGRDAPDREIVIEPTHVITRQSTDITAIDDSDVAAALNFIRRNASRPIQVEDVADAVCLSRRTLYDKFLRHVGRTVFDEIAAVRTEAVSKMLLETDFPISRIAVSLGFSSDKHIARYFSKITGLTPRMYREKFSLKQIKED